jgi:enoyl-CoA hydratase/carnithine racemase
MLKVESEGSILRVTLNRPEVKNAFNAELIANLSETFETLPAGTRVVVLSGAGETFCAGGDLNWMRQAADYTVEQNEADALLLARLFQRIATCPAVVIAVVRGACFGGGCGLVAASDVAFAEADTKFSFSEVKLGLVPATISPFVLPKIGAGHARHLFATGEIFDTRHALRIGLVHREFGDDALDLTIKSVLASGPEAVAAAKRLASQPPLSLEAAARLLAETRAGDEAREGIAAFLEKRRASFVERR